MQYVCLTLSLLLFSFQIFSAVETHTLDKKIKVTVSVPEGWESAENLFGIPLTVLGPWANESRPVMTFLFTHLTTKKFSEDEFQKLFKDFQTDKDEWVKSHKGELLKYEPTTKVELRPDLTGHFIGAEFKMNNIVFIERSYYLYCKDQVYNLKYSIRDEHRPYLPTLQKMVGEFKCE